MSKLDVTIPSIKLNDGTSMPVLAYGTGTAWYKKLDDGTLDRSLIETTKLAIRLGYHHLDGAEVYKTERELGIAIRESGVARERLFVTTKVITNVSDIRGAIDRSLEKLGLDYVDLYLIHSPFFAAEAAATTTTTASGEGDDDDDAQRKKKKEEEEKEERNKKLQGAWRAMEDVKAAGKAKSIGVSNYLRPHLEATLKTARVVPSVNQIELHPYLQHEGELLAYHREKGIAVSAYGPLTPVLRAKGGPVGEVLARLARKYYVSEGEVLLRWCVDQDAAVITTSRKEQRLSDYLRTMTFRLTPKEVSEINEAGRKKHYRAFWTRKFDPNDRS